MKKILAFVLVSYLTPSPFANASVCVMQSQGGGGGYITDTVISLYCDGKDVASVPGGATVSLQSYLSNGYKIVGQSSSDGSVIWTLVK